MPSLDAVLRQQAIADLLARFGVVRASALAKELGVSSVTIRSDLDELQRRGALRRTRGGAVPVDLASPELPLEETSRVRFAEKRKIGAAAMVGNGETIILEVGSTTTEVAKALPSTLRDVVVVTNALNIALPLVRNGLLTVALFSFVSTWNNFFLPLVVLSKGSLYPITLGLAIWNSTAQTGASVDYPAILVGALISVLPLIVAFFALQRYWQAGLTSGSLK